MSENETSKTGGNASVPGSGADAPSLSDSPAISGNDAVNLAAEQAKNTAHRNIPTLDDLPIPEDTANLRLGPNLHDGLLALLPLVGVWRGEGQADTPEGGQYSFGQQIIFSHDGENYLSFESRVWRLDSEGGTVGPDQRETGFWRINLQDEIEFVCTHASGVVEIYYGQPINERAWELESASTMVTATGPVTLGPGKRLYGLLPTNELGWVDERLVDKELKPRMSAQLHRIIG